MSKIVELKTEEIANVAGGVAADTIATVNAIRVQLPGPESTTPVNLPPPPPRPTHKLI